MRKTLAAVLAALTFGTAVAATALPAQADGYRHRSHRNNDAATAAIVAGVAGLALGAALSNGGHSSSYYGYRSAPAYGYGYAPGYGYPSRYGYAPGYAYGYDYTPRICESRRWVWDPYIGRRVMVRSTYRC